MSDSHQDSVGSRAEARTAFPAVGDVLRAGPAAKERPILFSAPMVRAILDGRKTQTRRVVKPAPFFVQGIVRDQQVLMWPTSKHTATSNTAEFVARCRYGRPGDTLWLRETWSHTGEGVWTIADARRNPLNGKVVYRATDDGLPAGSWWPSIHMPREFSRITLRITDVRVERLNDCSEADAIAEGLYRSTPDDEDRAWFRDHTQEHHGREPTAEELAEFNAGVWMAPGVPQGWGMTPAERRRDQWGPTAQLAYRLVWEHINGAGSWDANPWVWVVSFERVKT